MYSEHVGFILDKFLVLFLYNFEDILCYIVNFNTMNSDSILN